MSKQLKQAQLFHQLHSQTSPLIVYNIWDVGSAKALQDSGAKVIGTSSWAMAAAQGLEDGEKIPFEFILQMIKNIKLQMDMPISVDFESGYAQKNSEIEKNIEDIIAAGAVGINFEDQKIDSDELYTIKEQCERIHAIRTKAEQMQVPLFINARTDIFLKLQEKTPTQKDLEAALERLDAYAKAGANGFFVPGLTDFNFIKKICEVSPLPVNIMWTNLPLPVQELKDLGVARISLGPLPFLQTYNFLKKSALEIFKQ